MKTSNETKMINAGVSLLKRNANRIGLHLAMEGTTSALLLMRHIIDTNFPNVSIQSRKKMIRTFIQLAID